MTSRWWGAGWFVHGVGYVCGDLYHDVVRYVVICTMMLVRYVVICTMMWWGMWWSVPWCGEVCGDLYHDVGEVCGDLYHDVVRYVVICTMMWWGMWWSVRCWAPPKLALCLVLPWSAGIQQHQGQRVTQCSLWRRCRSNVSPISPTDVLYPW